MSAIVSALHSYVTRRGPAVLVIGAVHVALIWAVTSWTPVQAVFETAPIEVALVDSPTPANDVPPPPEPQIVPMTTPTIEPPLITLSEPPPENTITVAVVENTPPPAAAPPAPRVISDVAYVEAPQPRYPRESDRSGEEGLVVLRVLINERGRPDRVDVERSSGHFRLDEAARVAVQRALFRPYIENGVARVVLAEIPIEFVRKSRRADKSSGRG